MLQEKQVVVIIMPKVLERESFYELLQMRNYKIAVLGEEYIGDKADYFIQADAKNLDVVVSELMKFGKNHKIAMIFTISEYGIEVASEAADILDIPFASSFKSIKRARNKYLTREYVKKAGIASSEFFIFKTKSELKEKVEQVGFPFIIKPLNAGGSCSIIQINNKEELEERVEQAILDRDGMPVNDFRCDTLKEYWMAEEFLEGIEVSVESFTFNGETSVVAIHDKFCNISEPFFIEKLFVTPSPRLTLKQISSIEDMTKKVLEAIEYDYGISHVEFKVIDDGPRLLEVNARLGGGLIMESVYRSTGVNLLEVLLDIRSGKKPEINIKTRKNVAFSLITVEEGIVTDIEGFEEAGTVKNINIARSYVKKGSLVKARQANYGGFLLAEGSDIKDLINSLAIAEEKITISVSI